MDELDTNNFAQDISELKSEILSNLTLFTQTEILNEKYDSIINVLQDLLVESNENSLELSRRIDAMIKGHKSKCERLISEHKAAEKLLLLNSSNNESKLKEEIQSIKLADDDDDKNKELEEKIISLNKNLEQVSDENTNLLLNNLQSPLLLTHIILLESFKHTTDLFHKKSEYSRIFFTDSINDNFMRLDDIQTAQTDLHAEMRNTTDLIVSFESKTTQLYRLIDHLSKLAVLNLKQDGFANYERKMQDLISDKDDIIETKNVEIDNLKESLANSQKEASKYKELFERLNNKHNSKEILLELDEVTSKFAIVSNQNRELRYKVSADNDLLCSSEIASLLEYSQSLRNSFNKHVNYSNQTLNSLSTSHKELVLEMNELEQTLENVNQVKKEFFNKTKDLTSRAVYESGKKSTYKKVLLDKEMEQLLNENKSLRNEIQQLEQKISVFSSGTNSLKNDSIEVFHQSTALSSQLSSLIHEKDSLSDVIQNFEKVLENLPSIDIDFEKLSLLQSSNKEINGENVFDINSYLKNIISLTNICVESFCELHDKEQNSEKKIHDIRQFFNSNELLTQKSQFLLHFQKIPRNFIELLFKNQFEDAPLLWRKEINENILQSTNYLNEMRIDSSLWSLYLNAVDQLETTFRDLPVEFKDSPSSFCPLCAYKVDQFSDASDSDTSNQKMPTNNFLEKRGFSPQEHVEMFRSVNSPQKSLEKITDLENKLQNANQELNLLREQEKKRDIDNTTLINNLLDQIRELQQIEKELTSKVLDTQRVAANNAASEHDAVLQLKNVQEQLASLHKTKELLVQERDKYNSLVTMQQNTSRNYENLVKELSDTVLKIQQLEIDKINDDQLTSSNENSVDCSSEKTEGLFLQIKDLLTSVTSLQEELLSLGEQSKSFEQQLASKERLITSNDYKITFLSQEIEKYKTANHLLEERLESLHYEILEQKILEKKLRDSYQNINLLNQKLSEYKSKQELLNSLIARLECDLNHSNNLLKERQIISLNDQEKINNEKEAAEKSITDLNEKISSQCLELLKYQNENSILNDKIASVKHLEDICQKLNSDKDELTKQIENKESEIFKLSQLNDLLNNENTELKSQIRFAFYNNSNEVIQKKFSAPSNAKTGVNEYSSDLTETKKDNERLKQNIIHKNKQFNFLNSKVREIEKSNEVLSSHLEKMNKKFSDQEHKYKELIATLQSQIEALKFHHDDNDRKVKNHEIDNNVNKYRNNDEIDSLKHSISILHQQLNSLINKSNTNDAELNNKQLSQFFQYYPKEKEDQKNEIKEKRNSSVTKLSNRRKILLNELYKMRNKVNEEMTSYTNKQLAIPIDLSQYLDKLNTSICKLERCHIIK